MVDVPQYKCIKNVRALQIASVSELEVENKTNTPQPVVGYTITFVNTAFPPIKVPPEFFARGRASAGDYYVEYEDRYTSWSPKKVFESGYVAL